MHTCMFRPRMHVYLDACLHIWKVAAWQWGVMVLMVLVLMCCRCGSSQALINLFRPAAQTWRENCTIHIVMKVNWEHMSCDTQINCWYILKNVGVVLVSELLYSHQYKSIYPLRCPVKSPWFVAHSGCHFYAMCLHTGVYGLLLE